MKKQERLETHVCFHPVETISVTFAQVHSRVTDAVKQLRPQAFCNKCNSQLSSKDPSAARAIGLALIGSGVNIKKRTHYTTKLN